MAMLNNPFGFTFSGAAGADPLRRSPFAPIGPAQPVANRFTGINDRDRDDMRSKLRRPVGGQPFRPGGRTFSDSLESNNPPITPTPVNAGTPAPSPLRGGLHYNYSGPTMTMLTDAQARADIAPPRSATPMMRPMVDRFMNLDQREEMGRRRMFY